MKLNLSLKSLNRCDWYVLIWCLHQMQGLLYPEGPIGQALMAIQIVWAFYEAGDLMLPNRSHPPLLKATSILLLMYCVYGIVLMMFNPIGISNPRGYLQYYLISFLPIFLFYKYLKDGYLTEERIKKYIWLFLIVVIWHYFKYEQETLAKLAQKGSSREEVTNNTGYEFLSLIPITFFFYKKPLFQYSLLCLILLFIFMAMKRGPILIGGFCFVWALILNIKAAESEKQRYATILLGILIVSAGVACVVYQLNNSEYFNQRIEDTTEGKTSGRDHLYSDAIEALKTDTSLVYLLVGRGACGTFSVVGKLAHQDWLELAISNGLVGIVCMIYFCMTFSYTAWKKVRGMPQQIYNAFWVVFFIFISKTMFSMSLSDIQCFQSILIAFCIYSKEDERYNKKI